MTSGRHREQTSGWVERWAHGVVRHRFVVLALTLLGIGALGAGLSRIGFSNDYRSFFGTENPQLVAYEALQNSYTQNDNILFVVAPRDGDAFSPKTLHAIEELVKEAWKLPYAIRVDALTNYQHTRAVGDDLIVTDLVEDALHRTPEELQEARRVALSDPFLVRQLVAEDGKVAAVNVTIQFPRASPLETTESALAARALALRIEAAHPGIDLRLSGQVMLSQTFPEEAQSDMATLMPIMLGIILGSLLLLLRSVVAVIGVISMILLSIVGAMGATGWMGIQVTAPSSVAPTMIMTLAVADSVHLVSTALSGIRRGLPKSQAIAEGVRSNLVPIFLTGFTTIIGFLAMNASDSPPFHDLGNISAVGVGIAMLLSLTGLPALLAILPIRTGERPPLNQWLIGGISDFVVRWRKALLWGWTATVVICGACLSLNQLDDRFLDFLDESVEFRKDTEFAIEHLAGIDTIEYSVSSGVSGGVTAPDYLAKLDEFTRWFRAQPEVAQAVSFADVMRRINRNMHGDDPAWDKVPDNQALAAQYLLLYELSLPLGLDLNNQITVDRSATRLMVRLTNVSSARLRELAAQGEAWLREHAPPAMHARSASTSLMFAHISESNARGMFSGTVTAFIVIAAVLMLSLRSLRFGLISLLSNAAPATVAFGLWGIFVGEINVANAMVAAISLGMVDDDTVHFMTEYRRARMELRLPAIDAVRHTISTAGASILFTSTILAAGFGVLAFSNFELNAGMGQLTSLTILLALFSCLFFLGPLLSWLDSRNIGALDAALPIVAPPVAEVAAEPGPVVDEARPT